jgi:hypothetical protein
MRFTALSLFFLKRKETKGSRYRLREWKMREGGERESAPQARALA